MANLKLTVDGNPVSITTVSAPITAVMVMRQLGYDSENEPLILRNDEDTYDVQTYWGLRKLPTTPNLKYRTNYHNSSNKEAN